eukprot:CAMPEP_0202704140 /NCGR_PEP_ID=MMETSP1385-20130828/16882_1 /ASSEMBLY_ACC=CAM_ASM_000861 /TAXON_ID=933848 /ORGANISM="Elphidium margaritaceum" /LENGTH=203 /DNA_ID=CAMNT_0049362103 /DNA_START=700 /DNA_END=1311 /DNA_ORIENTATION=+
MTQPEEGKSDGYDSSSRLSRLIAASNKLIVNVSAIGLEDACTMNGMPIMLVNGESFTSKKRGVHVVDIEYDLLLKALYGGKEVLSVDELELKNYINYKSFDTFGVKQDGANFLQHLNSIKNRNIVILATWDSAERYWPSDAFKFFQYTLKMPSKVNSIGFRESFCLIAQNGIAQPYTSCVKKAKGIGPAQLNVVIKLGKDISV